MARGCSTLLPCFASATADLGYPRVDPDCVCVCVCVFIQGYPRHPPPPPKAPPGGPSCWTSGRVTRDGTQGGLRPGPVPCALVTTEPKQGNLVLRQSGVLDVRQECGRAPERIWPPDPGGSVSQMRAGDFRSRSVAGRTRCVPPRGISPMSGVPGPSYGMHALDEAGCSP